MRFSPVLARAFVSFPVPRSALPVACSAHPVARSPRPLARGVLLLVIGTLVAGVTPGLAPAAHAQDGVEGVAESTDPDGGSPAEDAATGTPLRAGARERGLARVLAARGQIEADLRALQEHLRSDASRGRESEIEGEIGALSEELSALNRNFSELAAGVDPVSIESEQEQRELNLGEEVRDLLGPLVNELKRATSRPREIDRLRTEISELRERLEKIDGAAARLEKIRGQLVDPRLVEAIDDERHEWERRRNAASASLQVAQQKLDQRLGESRSIAQAIENLFQIFFKSRGRNLLLALVAMIGFLYGIRRLRSFLASRPLVSRRAESFEGRVFGLIYSAFTVLGAVLVFLISLYFFGDWVLLILVLLLILGLIWTSKQAIPRFWSQTVLILDMGAVREGERVLYNGLPWIVDSISFYSQLRNPDLVGGTLRIPIDDLGELRSRAYAEDEPWFPTKTGDVVLLPDGRPAEVELQSIEVVRLHTPGENRLLVPAAEFAGGPVEILSGGYRCDITFGLDYGDQANITTTMREKLASGVESAWRASKWADSFVSCAVEFKEAGASSLDYFVRVDLDGSQAIELQAQTRALASYCVDVCNEEGWVIPFTQLTLHVAGNDATALPASDDAP